MKHRLMSLTPNLQQKHRLFLSSEEEEDEVKSQRAQSSHRELCFPQNCIRPADNEFLSRRTNGRRFRGSQMAEMAEIFPLFRYFSVFSVIDKDNSHGDWREDIFYNGRNGNYRKRRTSENRVILV